MAKRKIHLSPDVDLIALVDAEAKATHRTRTAIIEMAIIEHFNLNEATRATTGTGRQPVTPRPPVDRGGVLPFRAGPVRSFDPDEAADT